MTIDDFTKEAERLRPLLINTAMRYLHSEEDAADIVQDALLRMWQMHPTLHIPVKPLAVVIVKNLCISHLRKQHILPGKSDGMIADTDDQMQKTERIERMMGIIETLPATQQTFLRLYHMDGIDTRSISEMTGNSEAAVRKALSRARIAVREQYIRIYNSNKTHNGNEK